MKLRLVGQWVRPNTIYEKWGEQQHFLPILSTTWSLQSGPIRLRLTILLLGSPMSVFVAEIHCQGPEGDRDSARFR